MTIKIIAPVIWLDQKLFKYYSNRISRDEKSFRAVSESDWRKLMKLVRTVEGNAHGKYKSINDIYDALEALQEKKK